MYYGRARADTQATGRFSDNFVRAGGDAFVNLSRVFVYGTALYARDGNPLATGERRTFFGGFVQGDVYLTDRAVVLMRFDGVRQRLPAFFAQQAAQEPLFRVNTLAFTPGPQYLVKPNVKVGFEYQIRQARRDDRAIAQLRLSF